ncbi:MAG: hypothetical protein Q8L47_05480 [bacterium]|nr:hypothetical protein [bacterium]
MSNITIQKSKIKEENGVVILPIKEYQKLLERAVPTYYLTGKEAEKLDKLVEEGQKEYREGKTIKAGSIKEALKKYGSKRRD